jgi:hypothetical protein
MKRIAFIMIICIVGIAMLSGCSSNNSNADRSDETSAAVSSLQEQKETNADNTSITGVWTYTSVSYSDGTTLTLEEYCQQKNKAIDDVVVTYNLSNDFTITKTQGTDASQKSGTYKFDGKNITAKIDGEAIIMIFDEEENIIKITDVSTGNSAIYTKQ